MEKLKTEILTAVPMFKEGDYVKLFGLTTTGRRRKKPNPGRYKILSSTWDGGTFYYQILTPGGDVIPSVRQYRLGKAE